MSRRGWVVWIVVGVVVAAIGGATAWTDLDSADKIGSVVGAVCGALGLALSVYALMQTRRSQPVQPVTAEVHLVDAQPVENTVSESTVSGTMVQVGLVHGPVVIGDHSQVAGPGGVVVGAGAQLVPPRQLPLVVRDFTGRAEHLAALDALLEGECDEDGAPRAVVVSVVDGAAGIGKTTLAVYWAYRVQHRFPSGTLYVDLRGYGPGTPATAGEVLDGFLRALGTRAEAMPQGTEAQAALYRSLLTDRRVLIVLDNANSAEQVRPVLPGAPGCAVVVTSRDSLTGLVVTESATRLTLDLPTRQEALALVNGIIGHSRGADEPEAVSELISLCARLPLALRIAAGRAAVGTYTTVAEVVAELADDRFRLDALSRDGDERAAVRAVFDWSYQLLAPELARMFRRLGLHCGADFSVHAAAAVADLDPLEARQQLERLAAAHLIEPAIGGRYRFHDLLGAYSVDQARRLDSAAVRHHALESLLTWYARSARVADELAFPALHRLALRITGSVRLAPITDRAQALAWLNREQVNLLAALRQTARHEMYDHAIQLADSLVFLSLRGSRDEWLEAVEVGSGAARRRGDRSAETSLRIARGEVLTHLRRWDEAFDDLHFGLAAARNLGDHWQQAFALNGLGILLSKRGRFADALPYLQEALPLSRGIDTGRLEAVVEGNLSRACIGLDRHQQALEHGERGLILHRAASDLIGEARALHALACAWQGLGKHQHTITLCREAIALGRQVDIDLVAVVAEPLDTLAVSLYHLEKTVDAVECWQEAVAAFADQGEPDRAAQIQEHLDALRSPRPEPL